MKIRYFGWWIVIVGFFMMAVLFAPMVNLSGIFIIPLTEAFSISRSAAALPISISNAVAMVVSLIAGRVLSRYRIKKVVVFFLVVMVIGCLLCAIGTSFTLVIIGSVLRGISHAFATILPLSILIGNWFGPKIRGRAWSVTIMGSGVGLMILSPIMGNVIAAWGWQWGYVIYAMLALLMIPFVLLTFYNTPKDKGLEPMGMDTGKQECCCGNGEANIPEIGRSIYIPVLNGTA